VTRSIETTGWLALVATLAGCAAAGGPDYAYVQEAAISTPAPEALDDWEQRETENPRTHSAGVRYQGRCTDMDVHYYGTICFPLTPANACNEVDTLTIERGTEQTVSTGFSLTLPKVGVGVSHSQSVSYSTSTSVDVPGRDCHYCWRQVCYATTAQQQRCRGGGFRTGQTRWVVTYSSPVVADDPRCVRADLECGCGDAGAGDAGAGDAGDTSSGGGSSTDAGVSDAG